MIIPRNASKVGLRAVVGENNDVMGFVADDDLKVGGKVRITLDPYTELGISGYYNFLWRQFSPGDAKARRFGKEGIGQRQGFVLRQAQIAVLSVDQKQGFTRR